VRYLLRRQCRSGRSALRHRAAPLSGWCSRPVSSLVTCRARSSSQATTSVMAWASKKVHDTRRPAHLVPVVLRQLFRRDSSLGALNVLHNAVHIWWRNSVGLASLNIANAKTVARVHVPALTTVSCAMRWFACRLDVHQRAHETSTGSYRIPPICRVCGTGFRAQHREYLLHSAWGLFIQGWRTDSFWKLSKDRGGLILN
jgi:hypothetical protein